MPIQDYSKFWSCPFISHFQNTGHWPKCWRIQELLSNGGGLTFKQLDFEDLVSAMSKSLSIDFEKERKKIMKINSKYNPAEISFNFARIVSGVDSDE